MPIIRERQKRLLTYRLLWLNATIRSWVRVDEEESTDQIQALESPKNMIA